MMTILKVTHKDQYQLHCQCSNGVTYLYDMSFILHESSTMLMPLKDVNYFALVTLRHGHLTWPNGYDIHTETVMRDGVPLEKEAS